MKLSNKDMRLSSKMGDGRSLVFALLLAAGLLSSGLAQAACPLTPADRGSVKWNPGHYLMVEGNNSDAKIAAFINDFQNVPSMKGIQKTYLWSALNPSPGVYKFDEVIGPDLAKLTPKGKKLAIMVGYKYQALDGSSSLPAFVRNQSNIIINPGTSNQVSIPPYFVQGKPGDGEDNHGHHANFGHSGTRNKFNVFLSALSAKYDNNPNVVSISFIETSTGAEFKAGGQYPPVLEGLFLDGVLEMEKHAGCAFKKTPVFQGLNYPRNRLAQFTNNMKNYGIGLGGPDTFIGSFDDPTNGLAFVGINGNISPYPGVYHYYPPMSLSVPIGQQIHYGSLKYMTREKELAKIPHNLPPSQAVSATYNFAIEKLKANYLFWQIYNDERDALESRLKFGSPMPLKTSCPATYGGRCNAP